MAVFSRRAALLLGLCGSALPLVAQAPVTVVGRVVRFAGPDTLPVAGAEVVLHRVGTTGQGPLDSLRADLAGRFRFRFAADTAALFLLSARHDGITYFSSPVGRDPSRIDDILLIVSDTSSSAPVRLAARSVIVGAAEPSGDRMVVEVLEFANRGRQTRVAADSVPTLAVAMARGGEGFTLEDTDLSPDAVRLRNDSLLVYAPLAPGGRMAIVQYRIPAGTRRLELPAGLAVDTMQVLMEPGGLSLVANLPPAGEQVIDGRAYQRWMGPWPGDQALWIEVTGVTFDPRIALALLVGGMGLALAGGLVWSARRRPVASGASPADRAPRDPAALVDALARLDARYQGRRELVEPGQWQRYEVERARLKAELAQALARRGRAP